MNNTKICDDADYQEILDLQSRQSDMAGLIINTLNNHIEEINKKYQQFQQELESKCKFRQEILRQMEKNDVFKFRQSIINFQEEQQSILRKMEQKCKILVEALDSSIADFQQLFNTNMACFQNKSPKTFKYELINSIKNDQDAYAFSFSKQSQIMVGGYNSGVIKLFEFNKGQINLIQELRHNKTPVCCLFFMKKSQQFLARGDSHTIRLYQADDKSIWDIKQKLEGHTNFINCLLMNSEEDLIISGSNDKSIKFWMIQDGLWQCSQTVSCQSNQIISITLNDSCNQLLASGSENQILIIEQFHDFQWKIVQIISVTTLGYRLCYINDYMFVYQGKSKKKLDVYQADCINNDFKLTKQVDVNGSMNCTYYFPQQFIKSKSILVNKNGRFINFIKVNSYGELRNELVLEFEHEFIFGTMTDDGEYLIIYDEKSKAIQIRKYQE